jgi:predicted nucleic acid-binding protein
MSFLLDQDTCIAAVRQVPRVTQRVVQHRSDLYVSAVTVVGLELWVVRARTPSRYMQVYVALSQQLKVVSVDEAIAHRFAVVCSEAYPPELGRAGSRKRDAEVI